MGWYHQALLTVFQDCRKRFSLSGKDMAFWETTVFVNMCQYVVFLFICENTNQTWDTIPFRKVVDFCLEVLYRFDW